MIGLVRVDARADGTLFVQGFSQTDDWLWIASGDPVALNGNTDDEDLGGVVIALLDKSRIDVPRPERLDGLMKPLLAAAGVRSQRTYYDGTRSVGIHRSDGGSIEVTPSRRDHRSFLDLPDLAISLATATNGALGTAIRQALAQSE